MGNSEYYTSNRPVLISDPKNIRRKDKNLLIPIVEEELLESGVEKTTSVESCYM